MWGNKSVNKMTSKNTIASTPVQNVSESTKITRGALEQVMRITMHQIRHPVDVSSFTNNNSKPFIVYAKTNFSVTLHMLGT